MLFMKSSGGELSIVVLETEHLERLKHGQVAVSPDKSVMIAWTPDPTWLTQQIMASGGDAVLVGKAIEEAAKRPQQPTLEKFDTVYHEFDLGNKGDK